MATASNTSGTAPMERGPLRLQLRDFTAADGSDGAWWPRSRSLQTEAADLVDNFPGTHGRIHWLLFSRPDWEDATIGGRGVRMIRAARGPMRVGSFPTDDTQLIIASLNTGSRLRLQVIPSATDPVEAERRLRSAALECTTDDGGTMWTRWDNEIPWT